MYILLKQGEKRRPGDMMSCGRGSWYNPCNATWEAWEAGRAPDEVVRRELKGWEAVIHAIKAEVLGNDVEGCETVEYLWDCECEEDFQHPRGQTWPCAMCGARPENQPDSRKAEVILKIIERK